MPPSMKEYLGTSKWHCTCQQSEIAFVGITDGI